MKYLENKTNLEKVFVFNSISMPTEIKVASHCHLDTVSKLACLASISVGFRSKERQKNGISVFYAHEKWGERQKKKRWGWGRGRKETLEDKPLDFENHRSLACDRLG